MRLRIVEVNFKNSVDWLFKLSTESGEHFFIMNSDYYRVRNLESPVSKHELDYFDVGTWITGRVISIDGVDVIVKG